MNHIEYEMDKFAIVKENDFGEPLGKFRMIRYDTGYYALQRYNVNDFMDEEIESVFEWETMCIAPQIDDPLTPGRVWNLCQGKLTMNSLWHLLDDSSKLHNNELMELHLNLNPNLEDDVSQDIVRKIKTSEAEEIYDAIIESIKLQDDYVKEYYERQSRVSNAHRILVIVVIILIIIHIYRFLVMGV